MTKWDLFLKYNGSKHVKISGIYNTKQKALCLEWIVCIEITAP